MASRALPLRPKNSRGLVTWLGRGGRRRVAERRGTSAVEASLVLPVFLFFVFSLIEFAHAQMVNNVLRSACREGARIGSTEGNSTAQVEAHVRDCLASAIDPQQVTIYVKNAQVFDDSAGASTSPEDLEAMPNIELDGAEARQMFMVRAKVPYNQIALVPMPFMQNVVLQGQAFIRHE